jgi:hypothetical protein
MEVWVWVLDLPLDMMNRAYGELIGNWIGKFVLVDVDEEGLAWGEELRIRVEMSINYMNNSHECDYHHDHRLYHCNFYPPMN